MSDTSLTAAAPVDAILPPAGAPAADPAAPAAPVQTKEEQLASERLAQMARRQKQIYRQHREVQAKSQQLAAREQKLQEFEQWREQGKANPEQFMQQALGMTYDQLVQWKLNGGQVTPEMEVKAIRDDLARRDQEQRAREQKQAEQQKLAAQREADETVGQWKQSVADYLEANPEAYELTLKTDSHDLVTDTVEEHWKRSVAAWKRAGSPPNRQPKLMSDKEAADLVEKYIEDQFDNINSSSKKMSSRYAKRDAGQPNGLRDQARDMREGRQPTTLSSQIPQSAAPSMLSPANENDRIQRALAKLKGNG